MGTEDEDENEGYMESKNKDRIKVDVETKSDEKKSRGSKEAVFEQQTDQTKNNDHMKVDLEKQSAKDENDIKLASEKVSNENKKPSPEVHFKREQNKRKYENKVNTSPSKQQQKRGKGRQPEFKSKSKTLQNLLILERDDTQINKNENVELENENESDSKTKLMKNVDTEKSEPENSCVKSAQQKTSGNVSKMERNDNRRQRAMTKTPLLNNCEDSTNKRITRQQRSRSKSDEAQEISKISEKAISGKKESKIQKVTKGSEIIRKKTLKSKNLTQDDDISLKKSKQTQANER